MKKEVTLEDLGKICKFWNNTELESYYGSLNGITKNNEYPYELHGGHHFKHCSVLSIQEFIDINDYNNIMYDVFNSIEEKIEERCNEWVEDNSYEIINDVDENDNIISSHKVPIDPTDAVDSVTYKLLQEAEDLGISEELDFILYMSGIANKYYNYNNNKYVKKLNSD